MHETQVAGVGEGSRYLRRLRYVAKVAPLSLCRLQQLLRGDQAQVCFTPAMSYQLPAKSGSLHHAGGLRGGGSGVRGRGECEGRREDRKNRVGQNIEGVQVELHRSPVSALSPSKLAG